MAAFPPCASLRHKLTALLSEPGRLASLRAAAHRLARPRAAYDVAERSLAILPSLVPEPRFPIPAPAPSRTRRFWRTRPLAKSGSR